MNIKEGAPMSEQELTGAEDGNELSADDIERIDALVQAARENNPDDLGGFKEEVNQITLSGKGKVGEALVAAAVLLFAGGAVEKALAQHYQGPTDEQGIVQKIDDETVAAKAAEDDRWTESKKVTTVNLEGGPNPDAGEYSGEATMEGTADMFRAVVIDLMDFDIQDMDDQEKAMVVNTASNLMNAALDPAEQGSFVSDMGQIDAKDIAGAVEIDKDSNTIKITNLDLIKKFAKSLYNAAQRNIPKGMFARSVYPNGPGPDGKYDFREIIENIDWSKY